MWDFDGDEGFFFAVSTIASIVLAIRYYMAILNISSFLAQNSIRFLLGVWPLGCLWIVYFVLAHWSDPTTVRGHPDYMSLFMAGGALWIFATTLPGISMRDDVLERRNSSAAIVYLAAMLAQTLCYAGSNIGSGPTIWTTIIPAIIASGTLIGLWLVIETTAHISDVIAIERHRPSACVAAAFLVLVGVDLGWAMAGDFVGWLDTFGQFAFRAWPSVLLASLTIVTLRLVRPRCALSPPAAAL
jgi:hypothetical protein